MVVLFALPVAVVRCNGVRVSAKQLAELLAEP
jgi:hypothetical protein